MQHCSYANGICEWRDEELGVCFKFKEKSVIVEGETRVNPVIRLMLRMPDFSWCSVKFTIELTPMKMTPQEYRDSAISTIQSIEGTTIISKEDFIVGHGKKHPQFYYCANDYGTTQYVTNVCFTKDYIAVAFELESEKDIQRSLPEPFYELLRQFHFIPRLQSKSFLQLTEPQLGLGMKIPLGFSLIPSDHFDCGQGRDCCVFAHLYNPLDDVTIIVVLTDKDRNVENGVLSAAHLLVSAFHASYVSLWK
jgi:hypothetical protein